MKTSDQYKKLSLNEFTKAAKLYETDSAGVYKICQKDYPEILEEIEKEPFENLLDCGCGPAPMEFLLSQKYPEKHFTGIDLTPAMIELAKSKNIPNADFIVGDCENLPFDENSFDLIICSMSAHHYPNIQIFFDSVYKCLKPNGRFVLRDMTSDNKIFRWIVQHISLPLANLRGFGDVEFLLREKVQAELEKSGFKVEKNEIRKGFRLHLVARK